MELGVVEWFVIFGGSEVLLVDYLRLRVVVACTILRCRTVTRCSWERMILVATLTSFFLGDCLTGQGCIKEACKGITRQMFRLGISQMPGHRPGNIGHFAPSGSRTFDFTAEVWLPLVFLGISPSCPVKKIC